MCTPSNQILISPLMYIIPLTMPSCHITKYIHQVEEEELKTKSLGANVRFVFRRVYGRAQRLRTLGLEMHNS
jgi:hypothetical protein